RVKLHLCDNVQRRFFAFDARDHQPHFGRADAVSDARTAARDARNAYVRRTCEAWRTGGAFNQSKTPIRPSLIRTPPMLWRNSWSAGRGAIRVISLAMSSAAGAPNMPNFATL